MNFDEIDFDNIDMEFYDRQSRIKGLKRALMERHSETATKMAPGGYVCVKFAANNTAATVVYHSGEGARIECLVCYSPYIPLHNVAPSQFAWKLKQVLERKLAEQATSAAK